MPVFCLVKAASPFFLSSNLLGVAFPNAVSIAGNRLNTSGTEALSGENFFFPACVLNERSQA